MDYQKEYMIKTEVGEIYSISYGNGTPIIFLHGGPGLFHDYLVPYFIDLKDKHQLIFFDQPGSGKSTLLDHEMPLTIDNIIEVIEAIRKYLKLDKFNLISHSFGCILAVKYALKYPNTLLSNIMISPAPGNDTLDKEARSVMQSRLTEVDIAALQEIMSSSPFENKDIKGLNKLLKINESKRYFNENFLNESNQKFSLQDIINLQLVSSELYDELDDYNYYPLLKDINVKTIVIHGDYDPIPISSSQLYVDNINKSSLHIIKDSGHFPFIEKNKKVIDIISKFLI